MEWVEIGIDVRGWNILAPLHLVAMPGASSKARSPYVGVDKNSEEQYTVSTGKHFCSS